MQNEFIVSPFFLDNPMPKLEALALPGWSMVKPKLADGDIQHRIAPLHGAIADFVENAVNRGSRPASIDGGCCASIGMAADLRRAGLSPCVFTWMSSWLIPSSTVMAAAKLCAGDCWHL